jgi:hypothetical protein
MRHSPFATLLLLATLASCDYVEFPDNTGNGGGPAPEGPARKVLLEDLTGHTCNNCPAATDIAVDLHDVYGDALILVAVHATAFAEPGAPPYDNDYRTIAGEEYINTFGVGSLPAGFVSRREFNNSIIVGDGNWGSAVAEIINTPADVEVLFDTVTFDSGTNTVNMTIQVIPVNDLTGDHNLTVYLTEDSVVSAQIDNRETPPDVLDYVHRHMLRANVNGTWGEPVISGSASAGDTLVLSYSYVLPAAVIDPAKCSLVAYVYRTDNYEVLQAEEAKIQP